MKSVTIYTDGACSQNPGPGGWAAVLMYNEHKKELSGCEEATTNNRMELTAAIMGMRALNQRCEVALYTDSAYLCNGFKLGWIYNWQRNGWLTSGRKPVENQDLWQELLSLSKKHSIVWHKVKGHSDNEFNNRCDELARAEIKKLTTSKNKADVSTKEPLYTDGKE